MVKKMLIDATHAEETRVVVVDGNKVENFDFESLSRKQLSGNIYLAKVTRVEPSLQAAFVEYGGNRQGFLAFSEIHSDYYQIPLADREALLLEEEEERARQASQDELEEQAADNTRAENSELTETPINSMNSEAVPQGMEVTSDHDSNIDMEQSDFSSVVHEPSPLDPAEFGGTVDDSPKKRRAKRYKIQEVIKKGQIVLIQVVKEERGNKGAALTTYISLAGRYCVLMPNTPKGGGISRKITNLSDRKRLRDMMRKFELPVGMGLIVRTAGANRTGPEIERDYEYLLRQWDATRTLTLQSAAPTIIYEEANLIKRSLRDLYDPTIESIWVEGERGFDEASAYMKMLLPEREKYIKSYKDKIPLFVRYQVENQLASMFEPTVQLKSGGYIVIDITEALVSVDVNSGRSTKENSVEDTALKTNLEAAQELARQLKLRDMAGLIVVDFIDMDDSRNNKAVEKQMKESLKTDRARIQVGRISGFGLLEMSRQRLRPGIVETTTNTCPACKGTGVIRSDENMALAVLRQIEEVTSTMRVKHTNTVDVRCSIPIANYIINQKRSYILDIENRYGIQVFIHSDMNCVHQTEYSIETGKVETVLHSSISHETVNAESVYQSLQDLPDKTESGEGVEQDVEVNQSDEQEQQKKKRRRGRRGGRKRKVDTTSSDNSLAGETKNTGADDSVDDISTSESFEAVTDTSIVSENHSAENTLEDKPKKPVKRRTRTRKKPTVAAEDVQNTDVTAKTDSIDALAPHVTSTRQAESTNTKNDDLVAKTLIAKESPKAQQNTPAPKVSEPVKDTGQPVKKRGWGAKVLS